MITNNIQENSGKSILDRIGKKDQETLLAMYPDISEGEMKKKYKLFLEYWFYFPYFYDNIYADVEIVTTSKDKIKLPKYKVRNPFYNQKYFIINMQNKRRISKRGLPLIFDSFEELAEIEQIVLNWTVEQDKRMICELQINYYTSFEKEDGKTFYGIFNKDFLLSDAEKLENFDDIFNQYDIITRCTGGESGDVQSICDKEDEVLAIKNGLTLLTMSEKYSDKYQIEENDKSILYSYCAKVNLQPFTETRMLPCSYAYR